jgi:hypothetical protein
MMRRTLLALSLALLPLAAPAQEAGPAPPTSPPPAAAWKEFQAKQGRFSVLLPGTPAYEVQTRDFPAVGATQVHTYVLRQEPYVFLVVYADLPPQLLRTGPLAVADDMQNGFLESLDARLVSEKDIKISGKPGKEFRADVPKLPGIALSRAAAVGGRVYQIAVVAPREQSPVPELRKFLDSFKLLAPPKPAVKKRK